MSEVRLIDANALREEMLKTVNVNDIGRGEFWEGIAQELQWCIDLIDNAPTVEVPENEVNCVLTMFGKCSYNETGCSDCEIKDKIRKALNERPQDKWKVNKHGEHFCPRCGNYALYKEEQDNDYYEVQSNFCPECGADMRGGAE